MNNNKKDITLVLGVLLLVTLTLAIMLNMRLKKITNAYNSVQQAQNELYCEKTVAARTVDNNPEGAQYPLVIQQYNECMDSPDGY